MKRYGQEKMTEKYLIFDLDGTLIDTIPDLRFLLNGLLTQLGRRTLENDEMKFLIGQGSHYLIEQMCARTGGASPDEIEDIHRQWLKIYAAAPMDLTRPFDKVPETLRRFKDAGCKLAVCTNKPPAPTRFILDKLDLRKYFDAVLDAEALPFRKPRPEPLLEAARRMGGDPSRAVMIGDSEPDAQAAKAAGIPVVLLTYGYAQKPYDQLGANALADRFEDLYDIVLSLPA